MSDLDQPDDDQGTVDPEEPPPPPLVVFGGTSEVAPHNPDSTQELTVRWDEYNLGGPTADSYTAHVILRRDAEYVDERFVACSRLEQDGSAQREATFPAQEPSIGYTVEIYVDVENNEASADHNRQTYVELGVTVSEAFGQ